jgi:hypothetical protein
MMTSCMSGGVGNAQVSAALKDGYLRVVQRDVNDNGQLDGSIFNSIGSGNGGGLFQQSSSQDNIAIGGRDVSGTGVGTSSSENGVVNPRSASSSSSVRPANQQAQAPADMMQMLMPLMMMMFQMMMQMFQGNMGQDNIMSQQGSGLAGNAGSSVSNARTSSAARQPIQFIA